MSEQVINITSGFYDAIDNDRLYSADQMNMPYKRLVSNGVFATPSGTASTDFEVVSVSGMNIKITHGNAILGDKWVENVSDVSVTVPDNTDISPRIDSVFLQVDRTPSGRVANIVYRTGTPAVAPVAPSRSETAGVYEFRLANIAIAAGAASITDSVITDCRGSDECPWITSLIYQVDTSELYRQWQAAYGEYYESTTEMVTQFITEQTQAWQDFFNTATQSFTIIAYFKFTSEYATSQATTSVPINIPIYNKDTDILNVYINGLYAAEGDKYTVDAYGQNITLTNALSAGQTVYFECLHAVTPTNVETCISMINQIRTNDIVPMKSDITDLQADVTEIQTHLNDSYWQEATLSGYTAGDVLPAYRKYNGAVYIRGTVHCVTGTGKSYRSDPYFTLPAGFRPVAEHHFTAYNINPSASPTGEAASNPVPIPMKIDTNGNVSVYGLTAGDTFHIGSMWYLTLDTSFVVG